MNPSAHEKQVRRLIEQIAKGEREAFAEFYVLLYNELLRYGYLFQQDAQIIEDSIQDLFIWILEHPDQLAQVQHIKPYLFRALKQNLLRQRKRRTRLFELLDRRPTTEEMSPPLEAKWIEEEQNQASSTWMQQQLQQLPVRQREVLFLRFYEGMSYDEIAQHLSTSNQVVRNYASRALKTIRKATSFRTFFLPFVPFLSQLLHVLILFLLLK